MSHLNVTLVQADLVWEDPPANRDRFDALLAPLAGATDLVVLPEMFSTGFTMAGEALAEPMGGATVAWMKTKAAQLNAHLTGSLIVGEGGKLFNRLVWAAPNGGISCYDKRHRFRMSGEHQVYSAGTKPLTVAVGAWQVRPFICYDLRFPIWTRNVDLGYGLALFVANWPSVRSDHWTTLLKARAIENQAYVIGVNRVGDDGNGIHYSGDSLALDPQGRVLFRGRDREVVHTVSLDGAALEDYRQRFPAWRDAGPYP